MRSLVRHRIRWLIRSKLYPPNRRVSAGRGRTLREKAASNGNVGIRNQDISGPITREESVKTVLCKAAGAIKQFVRAVLAVVVGVSTLVCASSSPANPGNSSLCSHPALCSSTAAEAREKPSASRSGPCCTRASVRAALQALQALQAGRRS